jgi:hypothetical protein
MGRQYSNGSSVNMMAGHILDSSGSGQEQLARCCERGNETSSPLQGSGISWLAEDLLASVEGLYKVGWSVIYKDMSNLAAVGTFVLFILYIFL